MILAYRPQGQDWFFYFFLISLFSYFSSVYKEIHPNTTFITIAKEKMYLIVLNAQFTSYIDSLFLFLCHAQQNQDEKDDSKKKVVVIASIVSSVVATLLIFIFIYWSNAKNIKGKILPNSHILFS